MKSNLLRAAITKNEITIVELSKKIKLCESSLRLKINGKRNFTIFEADKVGKVLKLSDKEILEIFFDRVVS